MTSLYAAARNGFPRSGREYYANEPEEPLNQRRLAINSAWKVLKERRASHEEHRASVGYNPDTSDHDTLNINVGGVEVNIPRALLRDAESMKESTLGNLLGSTWDKRVPRDADGRIFLDESPECGKAIIHTLLQHAGKTAVNVFTVGKAPKGQPSANTEHRILHASTVFKEETKVEHETSIFRESKVIGSEERASLSPVIRSWCPGGTMILAARVSRDGLVLATKFKNQVWDKGTKAYLTLFRVVHKIGQFSVVGCFKLERSGSTTANQCLPLLNPFVFMLKNGTAGGQEFQPARWFLRQKGQQPPTQRITGQVPMVDGGDLTLKKSARNSGGIGNYEILQTGNIYFDVPDDSPFLGLSGLIVSEREEFRVFYESTVPRVGTPVSALESATRTKERVYDDVRNFGTSIARALYEEEVGLEYARMELEKAEARMAAAVRALKMVYGPEVAAGGEDAVIDLNVRGTKTTTLRSTLRACPTSDLATMFDDDKTPAEEKDADGNGRLFIDCKPSVFDKVLEVLRLKKRESWASSKERQPDNISGGIHPNFVVVDQQDLQGLKEFVGKHFSGCQAFIADMVKLA